ncbi:hypothetical protein HYU19_03565 [Candidatus Woesearchaeota archaeon]|nr:hypothetical protein [Candidatus Woesearchaeota archaeon]
MAYDIAGPAGAGILGMMGAFMAAYVIFVILGYVYFALALMSIAKKTNTPNPWLAWIPLANLYLMTQIAQVPWWTLIVFIVGAFIPFVNILVILGLGIWWWWRIAEARGKPGWWGILMVIPIVNIVMLGVLAWSD